MYRDDSEAARARIEALEAELRTTRRRIADRQSAIAEGCTSRVHLAEMKRVADLEAKLAKARQVLAGKVPPWQAELERQADELRAELADLEELGRGDAAMSVEIIRCRLEIETLRAARGLDLTVQGEIWVPVPWALVIRTLGNLWEVGVLVALLVFVAYGSMVGGGSILVAILLAMIGLHGLGRWSSRSLRLGVDGITLRYDVGEITRGTFSWDELREVTFKARGDLRVRCGTARFRFRASDPEFPAVARAVFAAAERREFPVRGQPPALLAPGPEPVEREP